MATYKHRQCHFCKSDIDYIDYKNVKLMNRFITKYCKIVPRYYSGTCVRHQKPLANAIKNARIIGLLPFTTQ
ncbi:MAG: 30S ribosomal protein S18 [Candidatus Peregrinibacteria bacterium]